MYKLTDQTNNNHIEIILTKLTKLKKLKIDKINYVSYEVLSLPHSNLKELTVYNT